MKEIELSKGYVTIVDDNMYELLCKNKWHVITGKYAARTVWKSKPVLMHRFIWEHSNDVIPDKMQIDHINGDSLDNRLENLRCVTNRQNAQNMKRHRQGKLVGVHAPIPNRTKPYQVQIWMDNKLKHIGNFTTEQEAHEAYMRAIS